MADYRRDPANRPTSAEGHNNFGLTLRDQGQLDEAVAAFRQAIALNGNLAELHNNLGLALKDKRQLDEAVASLRRAIALNHNVPEPYNNLGTVLRDQGQLDEAVAAFRQAIALNPNLAEVHNNLGQALADTGHIDQAVAAHQQAIALNPDFAKAHYNLGVALLTRGDFQSGWEEYEWRWKCEGVPLLLRNFPQPQWDGSALEGRTLLIHAEQGFGDSIKFARYVPLAAERGGKIIVACFPQLQRLFQSLPGKWPVVAPTTPRDLPPFDLHAPLMSLPRILGTTLSNIPRSVPYLQADAEEAANWKNRLANQSPSLKVGLVWAGNPTQRNNRNRSMKLEMLAPLGRVAGVRFFSLQKGNPAEEAKAPPPGMELVDWTQDLKDFADTAAFIANLDLVISVDTSVAHLTGAMGKPIWTMLSFVPGWHWMQKTEESPWYPTMRLFRQPAWRDWDSAVTRVAEALSAWTKSLS